MQDHSSSYEIFECLPFCNCSMPLLVTISWIKYQQVFNFAMWMCSCFGFSSNDKISLQHKCFPVFRSTHVADSSVLHTYFGAVNSSLRVIFYLVLLLTCLIITVWLNLYYCFSLALVISFGNTLNSSVSSISLDVQMLSLPLSFSLLLTEFSWFYTNRNSANKIHLLRCTREMIWMHAMKHFHYEQWNREKKVHMEIAFAIFN